MEHLRVAIGQALDKIGVKLYGMTRSEALERLICIKCKEPVDTKKKKDDYDIEQYKQTGLCVECYRGVIHQMVKTAELGDFK